jgi:hypothetical protein
MVWAARQESQFEKRQKSATYRAFLTSKTLARPGSLDLGRLFIMPLRDQSAERLRAVML